jgi:hypothetical protein
VHFALTIGLDWKYCCRSELEYADSTVSLLWLFSWIYQLLLWLFSWIYQLLRSVPAISTIGTSDINYYSVSTAGTVGGKYPLLSIDGADGNWPMRACVTLVSGKPWVEKIVICHRADLQFPYMNYWKTWWPNQWIHESVQGTASSNWGWGQHVPIEIIIFNTWCMGLGADIIKLDIKNCSYRSCIIENLQPSAQHSQDRWNCPLVKQLPTWQAGSVSTPVCTRLLFG